jgi:hypothetical protein
MPFLLAQLAKKEGIPLQMPKAQLPEPLWDIIGMAE